MREVVEVLVRALVDNPDAVRVVETGRRHGTVYLEVQCAQGDTGRIIGRGGRIANAIRAVANTVADRDNIRVVVDIAG